MSQHSPCWSPATPAAEVVTCLGLSYATHLSGSMEAVKTRSQETQGACGELARAMRDLVAVEEAYV